MDNFFHKLESIYFKIIAEMILSYQLINHVKTVLEACNSNQMALLYEIKITQFIICINQKSYL